MLKMLSMFLIIDLDDYKILIVKSFLLNFSFWKMANTFTGLKLKGELGRFGKTALTDIDGYVQLPDGKVLSGSESGNMLLWDGGLIKVRMIIFKHFQVA